MSSSTKNFYFTRGTAIGLASAVAVSYLIGARTLVASIFQLNPFEPKGALWPQVVAAVLACTAVARYRDRQLSEQVPSALASMTGALQIFGFGVLMGCLTNALIASMGESRGWKDVGRDIVESYFVRPMGAFVIFGTPMALLLAVVYQRAARWHVNNSLRH